MLRLAAVLAVAAALAGPHAQAEPAARDRLENLRGLFHRAPAAAVMIDLL